MAAILLKERYIYYLSFTLKCVVYTLNMPNVHPPPPPDASLIDTIFVDLSSLHGNKFNRKNID